MPAEMRESADTSGSSHASAVPGRDSNGTRGSPIARYATAVALLLVAGPVGAGLAGLLARWSWFFALACHFRAQCILSVLAGTLLLLAACRWRLALASGILAVVFAGTLWPYYFASPVVADAGRPLRVVSFNVHSINRDYARVLSYVRETRPDVAVFYEVNERWGNALATLATDWPHFRIVTSPGNFGIALFSRLPLEVIDAQGPDSEHLPAETETTAALAAGLQEIRMQRLAESCPALFARVVVGETPVTIVGAHVYPPTSAWAAARRNAQLDDLAELIRKLPPPCVVVGDFNATSWSPAFGDLAAETGLRDTRLGFGLQPSWPSGLPAPFRIPIDHCLVSPTLGVRGRQVGPDLGSDHLPVLVDLRVPTN